MDDQNKKHNNYEGFMYKVPIVKDFHGMFKQLRFSGDHPVFYNNSQKCFTFFPADAAGFF